MGAGVLFALAAGLMWGLVFIAPLLLPDYPAALLAAGLASVREPQPVRASEALSRAATPSTIDFLLTTFPPSRVRLH